MGPRRAETVALLLSLTEGRFPPSLMGDVREGAEFTVGRALGLMGDRVDCVISLGQVALTEVTTVNPDRVAITAVGGYPQLRRMLTRDPSYEAVPLSVGRSRQGTTLWDGHRRFETYRAAGRGSFPAWIATFRRGSGLLYVSDRDRSSPC